MSVAKRMRTAWPKIIVPSSPWRAIAEASVVVAFTVHCVEEASVVIHVH